ncbi:MAG: succinate-semialdehyde dehydrogenase / glutarate-semialdehyde dehydrogenase, partial [Actinomycetota bacterium]|nr:succinate-semialdehyde dehydrogenase / glutarate-semialdehyde dehydrogenase [Actinomycetota bacterium]
MGLLTEHLQLSAADLTDAVVRSPGADNVTTCAPFTGEPLAELPVSTPDDVIRAYAVARAAQQPWSARPLAERTAVFLRLHDLVLDRQDEVLDLVQLETGKARRHALEELIDVALTARHYARTARRYLAPVRHSGIVPVLSSAHELHHPKGVVGIVSPWNYPLTLAVTDAIPAFVAGNAVVHKPDTQTALTALWIRALAVEAGLPPELWQVVLGDGPVVGRAVVDGGDFVCFTGSTPVGREVAERCARRLVGCSLELGGKNPMLVLPDADLDRAAEGAVRDCFSNAGQLCVSMERLYLAESVHDAFLDRFLARVRAMRLGSDLAYGPDMGSLISAAQLDRVSA